MECKTGYEGALCATCSYGYFPKLRDCVRCEEPDWAKAVLAFFVAVLIFGAIGAAAWRLRSALVRMHAFAHIKILVSFVTVACTLDQQFGVPW
jgi:hypothetical protein